MGGQIMEGYIPVSDIYSSNNHGSVFCEIAKIDLIYCNCAVELNLLFDDNQVGFQEYHQGVASYV